MPLRGWSNGEPTSRPCHVAASSPPPRPASRLGEAAEPAVERAAEREGGRGEHHRAVAEQLVAQQPADRRAARPAGRRAPVAGAVQPDHLGRARWRAEASSDALGGVVHLVQRGLSATLRGRASSGIVLVAAARPSAVRHAAAASRTQRERQRPAPPAARPGGRAGPRPAARSSASPAVCEPVGGLLRRSAGRRGARPRSTMATDSSPVAAEVTRSTSSCASSMITHVVLGQHAGCLDARRWPAARGW